MDDVADMLDSGEHLTTAELLKCLFPPKEVPAEWLDLCSAGVAIWRTSCEGDAALKAGGFGSTDFYVAPDNAELETSSLPL